MAPGGLTPTSFIVLGLLERLGEATPYELKRTAAAALGNFWSVPHSQVYAEPERLERSGHVVGEREEAGRRRKLYQLTERGEQALDAWRQDPEPDGRVELRDPSLLKLALGAAPASLAPVQLAAHRQRLAEYQQRRAEDSGDGPRGPWLTLEAGIAHEAVWIRFWSDLAERYPEDSG